MAVREISLSDSYLSVFFLEMHQLLEQGKTVADALDIIKRTETEKETKNWIARVEGYVVEGKALSKALDISTGISEHVVYMIEAAEESKNISNVMLELHRYYNNRIKVNSKIKEGIALPIIQFISMLAVVILLITLIIPMFNVTVAQLSGQLSSFGKALVNAGAILLDVGKILGIVVLAIVVLFGLLMLMPSSHKSILKAWRHLVGATGVYRTIMQIDFASNMATLLSSGTSLEKSFELASNVCKGSKKIDSKLDECKNIINENKSIVKALEDTELFSDRHIKMLKIAEETGDLAGAFRLIADEEQEVYSRKVDTRLNILEPTMMVVCCLVCGLILISGMISVAGLMV